MARKSPHEILRGFAIAIHGDDMPVMDLQKILAEELQTPLGTVINWWYGHRRIPGLLWAYMELRLREGNDG